MLSRVLRKGDKVRCIYKIPQGHYQAKVGKVYTVRQDSGGTFSTVEDSEDGGTICIHPNFQQQYFAYVPKVNVVGGKLLE